MKTTFKEIENKKKSVKKAKKLSKEKIKKELLEKFYNKKIANIEESKEEDIEEPITEIKIPKKKSFNLFPLEVEEEDSTTTMKKIKLNDLIKNEEVKKFEVFEDQEINSVTQDKNIAINLNTKIFDTESCESNNNNSLKDSPNDGKSIQENLLNNNSNFSQNLNFLNYNINTISSNGNNTLQNKMNKVL